MGMSDKDRKHIWAKARNICSYDYVGKDCQTLLVETRDGKNTTVGDECHIIGEKPGAARYIADYPDRDSYNNFILMCKTHHSIIDGDETTYTIELLKTMKTQHENKMKKRLSKNRPREDSRQISKAHGDDFFQQQDALNAKLEEEHRYQERQSREEYESRERLRLQALGQKDFFENLVDKMIRLSSIEGNTSIEASFNYLLVGDNHQNQVLAHKFMNRLQEYGCFEKLERHRDCFTLSNLNSQALKEFRKNITQI